MRGDSGKGSAAGVQLHEDLSRDEMVVGPSDRSFGFTVAGASGLIGAVRFVLGHGNAGWWLATAFAMLLLAWFIPSALAVPNRLWLRLSLLLYRVVNPIALGLVFFVTIVPIGMLLRAIGKDPLRLRRAPEAASYWLAREPRGSDSKTMKYQF